MRRPGRFSTPQIIEMAKQHFGLIIPFSMDTLKKAYRKRAAECHPDRGGNEEDFKSMANAYEAITSFEAHAGIFVGSNGEAVSTVLSTIDGTPLSELGLGLGPTMNGADCERCDHKGYTTFFGQVRKICEACDERGMVNGRYCRECFGTKMVHTKSEAEQYDRCGNCNGTGEVRIWNPVIPKGRLANFRS